MNFLDIFSLLLVMAATSAYINHRYLKFPTTIGIMLIALLLSLALIAIGQYIPALYDSIYRIVKSIDFSQVLMQLMLSSLLFAGALHVDIGRLAEERVPIMILSTTGVMISTFLVGTAMYYVLPVLGLHTSYIHCLLFGSLISPTDPIAVLSILKEARVPHSLEVKISGESLFNDGVAVVVFASIYAIARDGVENMSMATVAGLFAREALGGLVFGLVLGYLGYMVIKSIDAYVVEVMITLALVMGGYSLATHLHISAPLAIVVTGLIMGNRGRARGMSDVTREYVDKFWEIIDEVLNALLFMLIGLEILVIAFRQEYVVAGLLAIPVVLMVRWVSVAVPISLLRFGRSFVAHTVTILTWGGLRGGISVALALSLQPHMSRDLILSVTYIVVIFSIVFQGLTLGRIVKRLNISEKTEIL